ncbi:hypothetical protein GYA27_00700 [candidate division WWE3 bacterium]|uniref:Uncharacterized protein n=1 Tax=candidate division WWE3 bacterium TaxID=2053526 RepID=A0A7X9HGA6_UNCKA|nr:hypothetical protein [candidate division WWE3 bacterium]
MIQGYMPDLRNFCEKHDIVFFEPTEENKKKVEELLKTIKFPEIEGDVTCYIRYFGPWGMYHPDDNCISICPLEIEKAPSGLIGVVRHEIIHLEHPEANSMKFDDKEEYINEKASNSIK